MTPHDEKEVAVARFEVLDGVDRVGGPVTLELDAGRFESLDAVYAQRWDEVADLRTRDSGRGVHPTPWRAPRSARWYAAEDLQAAVAQWRAARSPAASDRATPAG